MAARWFRHPATWIFAPTALALLYVLGHALFAREPTLDDLPPREAVLVQRFRSLDVFDRMSPQANKKPSSLLGETLNVPGLPGVDRAGPVHLIQLPRISVLPRSLVVLSVEDDEALDARFHDIELIEKGFIRHAQHMRLLDGWAAFSPDRDLTGRLGEGGITAKERNEDYSLAADVPRLVDHALTMPRTPPWRGLLEDLGVRISAALVAQGSGAPRSSFRGMGHLRRLQTTWATARMWAWFERDGQPYVEVALAARPGPVRDMLAALSASTEPAEPPTLPIPAEADAWLRMPDGDARTALAVAAFSLGFAFGHDADAPGGSVPPAIAALSRRKAGGLAVWAQPSMRAGVLDLAAVAPADALPDPAAWLPVVEPQTRRVEGFDVVAGGADAKRLLDRYRAAIVMDRAAASAWRPQPGERTLATFRLSAARAAAWIGDLVGPGGLWGLFGDRDLEGLLTTDGTGLRLRIRAVAGGP